MRTWLLLLVACAGTKREPLEWTQPIEVASGGGQKGPWQQNDSHFDYVDDPSVVLDESGAAAIAWVDNKRKDVFFTTYGLDGRPRSEPVNVSRTPAVFSWLPRLVVVGRDVYVLWQEIVFSGGTHGGEIFFARSRDGGVTFDEPLNLSRSKNGDGKARIDAKTWLNGSLDLARDDASTLYATWTEYDGPLWFARSTDGGASFSTPLLVDDGKVPARAPALAIGDGVIYLAWTVGEDAHGDVRIATSRDGGGTFSPAVVIARTAGYSDAPKLAVDRSGTVHIVFAESRSPLQPGEIHYARSSDRGATFDAPRPISSGATAGYPALALEGDRVFVSWELYQEAGKPRGLALAYSLDGGATFSSPSLVAGSRDPAGGSNGSHQGPLMRKLAVRAGIIAIVNSALVPGVKSRVWLVRGRLRT